MDELVAIPYQDIPALLSHYTNPKYFKSILSGEGGKGKEICLRAYSNMRKNDEQELQYGKKIYLDVKEWLEENNKRDYLNPITDEQNSYSFSFTEGGESKVMIEYGILRLDFNLTKQFDKQELMLCDYREEEELSEYADLFKNEFEKMFQKAKEHKDSNKRDIHMLVSMIQKWKVINESIKEKVYYMKNKAEWGGENEWRFSFLPDDTDHVVYFDEFGKPYKVIQLPIDCLESVCLFNVDGIDSSKSSYQYKDEFEDYLAQHGWNIPVIIENL